MKMAEPPSEAVAEEPVPNQEDSVMIEKPPEDSVTEIIESGLIEPVENVEAEVTDAEEKREDTDTDAGDHGTNAEQTVSYKDNVSKPVTGEETSGNVVEEPQNAEDPTQNVAASQGASGHVEESVESVKDNSKHKDTAEPNVIDDGKREAVVEEVIEPTAVPAESAVNVQTEHAKDSTSVDQNKREQSTDNLVEDSNEELSRLTKKQLRERYENLQTKYSASELQLDSLREQNAELITKIATLEEERQQAGSKSSSVTDMREKARQRDGLRVQADYLAHELSQVQDTEKYLREKVAEILEEKEESERRVKDLQLRLKRFVKDDEAKDARVAKLETELREVSQEVQQLEGYLDDETLQKVRRSRSNTENSAGQNGDAGRGTTGAAARQASPTPQSKTCVIL